MGPFMVMFLGMSLVTVPEAARVLRRSPRHLPLFCVLVARGLAAGARLGSLVLVALPRGLGAWLLGRIWRPAYPLVLPHTIFVMGGCISDGATAGLHALGAAKRSLRAMLLSSVVFLGCGLVGASFVGPRNGSRRCPRDVGRSDAVVVATAVWRCGIRTVPLRSWYSFRHRAAAIAG